MGDPKDAGHGTLAPELAQQALAEAGRGVMICDARQPDHPVVYVNEAFERLTGRPRATLLGRSPHLLRDPKSDPSAVERITEAIKHGRDCHLRLVNHRPDGSSFWDELYLYPLFGDDGRPRHYVSVHADITAQVEHEARVAALAYTDELTGLANRAVLQEHLDLALARASRYRRSVALLFLDCDEFKRVNDSWGHDVGDEVLRSVADRLKAVTRSSDLLARRGGDEFLLLVTDIEGDAERLALSLARNLSGALEPPFAVAGIEALVRASVGISIFPRDAGDAVNLLRHADEAMYDAKRTGAGVRLYAPPSAEPR